MNKISSQLIFLYLCIKINKLTKTTIVSFQLAHLKTKYSKYFELLIIHIMKVWYKVYITSN